MLYSKKTVIGLTARLACMVAPLALSIEKGNAAEATNATDYSVAAHWMYLPATAKTADVFYLYPTAWTSTNSGPEICAIDNPSMLQQAPQASARQVTAFETIGNIYAPFYRQNNNSPVDRLNIIAGIPTTDATAAFDYYIKHYNNGRPFILAGHSQGSDVLSNLLTSYMKSHPEVQARMIAAYVIGYPVTSAYLSNNPHLKFAEGSNDTGVIISYNTQAPAVPPGANPVLSGMTGIVINPILWTRKTTLAATNQGFGSFMPNSNGVYERTPQCADARVDIPNGVLICSTADTNALGQISGLAAYGIFHNFDYPFYYYNIRSNAADRTQAFLNQYYFTSSSVCADYDGDRKADPTVYDEAAGTWKVKFSSEGYYMITTTLNGLGGPGCASASADYDGDGKADPAVYLHAEAALQVRQAGQETTGTWKVMLSSANYALMVFTNFIGGLGYTAMPADYDGDGLADPAVYQRNAGNWSVMISSANYHQINLSEFLGGTGCRPVAADYDGDGKADPTIYREDTGCWIFKLSSIGYVETALAQTFGGTGWAPVPADYDGDGLTDPAVRSQTSNEWIVMFSTGNYAPVHLTIVFE